MADRLSKSEFILGLLNPMSAEHAIDPFIVKGYTKASLVRLLWTSQSKFIEYIARSRHRQFSAYGKLDGIELIRDRGPSIPDTAVATGQLELLVRGLTSVANIGGDDSAIPSFFAAGVLQPRVRPSAARDQCASQPICALRVGPNRGKTPKSCPFKNEGIPEG